MRGNITCMRTNNCDVTNTCRNNTYIRTCRYTHKCTSPHSRRMLPTLTLHIACMLATTNKTEMLDDAVKSRLWLEEAPAPNLEEMKAVAKSALPIAIINGKTQDDLLALAGERIEHHINQGRPASFRLARMAGIEVLIKEVIGWE